MIITQVLCEYSGRIGFMITGARGVGGWLARHHDLKRGATKHIITIQYYLLFSVWRLAISLCISSKRTKGPSPLTVALRGEKGKLRFVFIAPVYIKIITAGKCRETFLRPLPDGLNQKNYKIQSPR